MHHLFTTWRRLGSACSVRRLRTCARRDGKIELHVRVAALVGHGGHSSPERRGPLLDFGSSSPSETTRQRLGCSADRRLLGFVPRSLPVDAQHHRRKRSPAGGAVPGGSKYHAEFMDSVSSATFGGGATEKRQSSCPPPKTIGVTRQWIGGGSPAGSRYRPSHQVFSPRGPERKDSWRVTRRKFLDRPSHRTGAERNATLPPKLLYSTKLCAGPPPTIGQSRPLADCPVSKRGRSEGWLASSSSDRSPPTADDSRGTPPKQRAAARCGEPGSKRAQGRDERECDRRGMDEIKRDVGTRRWRAG